MIVICCWREGGVHLVSMLRKKGYQVYSTTSLVNATLMARKVMVDKLVLECVGGVEVFHAPSLSRLVLSPIGPLYSLRRPCKGELERLFGLRCSHFFEGDLEGEKTVREILSSALFSGE